MISDISDDSSDDSNETSNETSKPEQDGNKKTIINNRLDKMQ